MSDRQKRLYNIRLSSQKDESEVPAVRVVADSIEDSGMGKSGGRVKLILADETVASFDSKKVVGWWIEHDPVDGEIKPESDSEDVAPESPFGRQTSDSALGQDQVV